MSAARTTRAWRAADGRIVLEMFGGLRLTLLPETVTRLVGALAAALAQPAPEAKGASR